MVLGNKKKAYKIILDKKVKILITRIAKTKDRSSSWYINEMLRKHLNELGYNEEAIEAIDDSEE